MSINCNPLDLTSATVAWKAGGNLPTRFLKTTLAATKDILVVNPKKLVLDNYDKLSVVGDAALSVKQKIATVAVVVFGTFYTCMLYGSTVSLFGRCAFSLGCKFGMASLIKTGLIAKKLGTDLFVIGALPAYCLACIFPKKIGLTFSALVKTYTPKINLVANWIFKNILEPLWNKILVPVAHFTVKAIRVIGTKLSVAMKAIGSLISGIAQKLFDYVLAPIWNKALAPLGRSAGNAMRFIAAKLSTVLKAVADLLSKLVNPVFKYVLEPLWKKVLSPCWRGVVKVSQSVFYGLIRPFYTKMVVPASVKGWGMVVKAGESIGNYATTSLVPLLKQVAEKVGAVSKSIWDRMIPIAAEKMQGVVKAVKEGIAGWNVTMQKALAGISWRES